MFDTPDLFTPTFFVYFLPFFAPKYALRITIAKLENDMRKSRFFNQFSFISMFFLFTDRNYMNVIVDTVSTVICKQTSGLVMLCKQVSWCESILKLLRYNNRLCY